jgi:hypothetical protein
VLKYLRYHYDIKKYIAECARNPFVASAVAPLHAMSRRFYFLHYRKAHDLPVAARHHADVIRAIALGEEAPRRRGVGCADGLRRLADPRDGAAQDLSRFGAARCALSRLTLAETGA